MCWLVLPVAPLDSRAGPQGRRPPVVSADSAPSVFNNSVFPVARSFVCFVASAAQASQELAEIVWQRRLESKRPPIDRMREREPVRMECLTRMRRARPCGRATRILPLANQRVATPRRLNANLIPLAGVQPHLDE